MNLNKKFYKPFKLINSPGTEWSMGSMAAVLCGLPYKPNKNDFLNNIKCIQDYTNELDFETEFISSSPLNFHSLENFLNHHKFDKSSTQQDFINQGFELNLNSFFTNSISDIDLIDYVFSRVENYNNLDKNFFIFAQTLDTHVPGNHFDRKKCKDFIRNDNIFYTQKFLKNFDFLNSKSENIKKNYYELVRDVYENKFIDYVDFELLQINFDCLSNKILEFIKKVDAMNIDDLSIYLVADHKFTYKDNSYEQNYLFNYIYTDSLEFDSDINNKLILSHYDIFPYLLNLLGFELKSEQAGVGYLFPKQDINLINRDKILNEFLIIGSPTYDNLASNNNLK
jgi:Txe/YoeB family toxin of Txe-Axe toxin-antitoxin module